MAWQPAPARTESGLANAGRMLLLVGGILGAALGALMLLLAIGMTALADAMDGEADPFPFIGAVYGGLAAVMVVGSVLAFLAYGRAKRGDWHGAWLLGIVGALLPPVQVVILLGAIFCLTCPEHEAQRGAPPAAPSARPPLG